MLTVLFLLPFRGESGANDADQIVIAFRIDNDRDAAIELADCDKPILGVRVSRIKDFKVVLATGEEQRGFQERQAVLLLIAAVLGSVLMESHGVQYKPMA